MIEARDQLRSIVERVENINSEIADRQADRKEIFSEATGNGFDAAAIRKIVALRKLDPSDRMEQETVLETYMISLGMAPDTGEA